MADGITRIAVEGFKSIVNRQEIEIAPLTILAGANSSGKSSIMQPLLMLKQTLEAQYDPGPLKIDGPNVKFTSSDQFLSKTEQAMSRRLLWIKIATSGLEFAVTFLKGTKSGLELVEETYEELGSSVTLRPDMSSQELGQTLAGIERFKKIAHHEFNITQNRYRLNLNVKSGVGSSVVFSFPFTYPQDVIHVPGLRANPSRTYAVTATGPGFPGTFEHYVASVISHWQSEVQETYQLLNRDLEYIGLTQRIVARSLNETELELQVSRLLTGRSDDLVSIADVGVGVSQTLPVLVALRAAADGQLVYLEEPEIHLHPRAQTKLADILADAAKRGVRVVAETHSSLLLRATQTLVAKGLLSADLVRLHWFSRDAEGITQVKSATPDENGAFGDWPEDFGDVALQSEKEYLDAVESKLAR
jgi:predicted ATPase